MPIALNFLSLVEHRGQHLNGLMGGKITNLKSLVHSFITSCGLRYYFNMTALPNPKNSFSLYIMVDVLYIDKETTYCKIQINYIFPNNHLVAPFLCVVCNTTCGICMLLFLNAVMVIAVGSVWLQRETIALLFVTLSVTAQISYYSGSVCLY